MKVSLPGIIEMILQLDDEGMRKAHGIEVVGYVKRGFGGSIVIEGSRKALQSVLYDCDSRGNNPSRGEGWDQPSSWRAPCRIAAKRIRAALTAEHENGKLDSLAK